MKNITVAIGYPDRPEQWALLKAAALAERTGARLTLLHTFSLPYPLADSAYRSAARLVGEAREARRQKLIALAGPLRIRQSRLAYEVSWDVPVAAAIVRHVLAHRPDLLLADSHRHGHVGRWLLTNTDWDLIRACPCPLWFVKSPALARRPRVLAAVDPLHADAAHHLLDDAILRVAKWLRRDLGGAVSLVHVNEGSATVASHDAVAGLARRHRLGTTPRVFASGDPAIILPLVAKAEDADVVIMGAISRRAHDSPFIGGTAERVIDQMRCDILVVKPPAFVTDVAMKPTLRVQGSR